MALGAEPVSILKLVLGQGTQLTLAGIAAELLGALTRVMPSLLFGIKAPDAATFVSVAVMLGAVALVAMLIPAGRAVRVDPVTALRDE